MLSGERGPSSVLSPASRCSPECLSPCGGRTGYGCEVRGGGGMLKVEIMEVGLTWLFIGDCLCADWINSVITND